MSVPRVSVIIPVHNRKEDIINLVCDLIKLNEDDLEIILVDDASEEKIEFSWFQGKNEYFKILRNERSLGAAWSRNIGAESAKGEFFWFLDSDIRVNNINIIQNLINTLKSDLKVVSGGIIEKFNSRDLVINHKFLLNGMSIKEFKKLANYKIQEVDLLATASLFIRRGSFELVGGFNSTYIRDEDTDLCLKLKKNGYKFIQSRELLVNHLMSELGRETSFDNQKSSLVKYLNGLLESRLNLIQNYFPYRLLIIPLLDFVSATLYLYYYVKKGASSRIFQIFGHKKSGYQVDVIKLFSIVFFHYLKCCKLSINKINKKFYVNPGFYQLFINFYFLLPNSVRHIVRKYLFKKSTAKLNINEIEKITFFLTDGCNLSCPHCFAVNKDVKFKGLLRSKDYARLFNSLSLAEYKIHLTGGEPTLHPDFLKIVELAARNGNCRDITIFTNATNPTKILDIFNLKLFKMNINIQMSLDGLVKFHNEFRGRNGNFEETLELIEKLERIQHPNLKNIIVNTSINHQNRDEISALIEMLSDRKVLHYFNFTRSKDVLMENEVWGPTNFDNSLSLDEREQMLIEIDKKYYHKNTSNLLIRANRAILKNLILIQKRSVKYSCVAGIKNLTILPNGDIAKCEVLEAKGNLKDYDMNLNHFKSSQVNKKFHAKNLGCACLHDCGVSNSIVYNESLLKELV